MNETYSENDLRTCLRKLGVKKGDCLFVHSALKSLGKFSPDTEENTLEALFRVLSDEVGEDGTIVVPSFNFAFCNGATFDIDNTPGDGMGAFSEFVRTRPDAIRTKHPFHSVASIGRNAKAIADCESFSEFSDGSFFDKLLKLDSKILFFGIDFVETFVHIAEERAEVPYRFWKTFTGKCISNEAEETLTFNFYARHFDADPVPTVDVDKINKYLREKDIILSKPLGSGRVSICNSVEMVGELTRKFSEDPLFPLMN
jgi:aminoglycoside 3-N-acetyltransferase